MEMSRALCWSLALAAASLPNTRTPSAEVAGSQCFADGAAVHSLAQDQRSALDHGDPVVVTTDLPNRRWPRVCVYQFIAASPEQSIAVFVDYPLRPSYLPQVRQSTVVPATADSLIKRVAYVLHVVFRVDETDTLREVVRPVGESANAGYQLAWMALSSTMAQSVEGFATFVPWHNDASGVTGTLMVYDQTVEPGSRLARLPLIRKRGIAIVRDAALAIARQVEKECAHQPAQLERQVAELRRRLRE